MLRCLSIVLAFLCSLIASAAAQDISRGSECLAMANAPPRVTPVNLRRAAANTGEVAITYAGHSTYIIDTPGGVRIATDYNGVYRSGRLPDVATMNRARGPAIRDRSAARANIADFAGLAAGRADSDHSRWGMRRLFRPTHWT
jgi:hypothetical protein